MIEAFYGCDYDEAVKKSTGSAARNGTGLGI